MDFFQTSFLVADSLKNLAENLFVSFGGRTRAVRISEKRNAASTHIEQI